MSLSYYECAYIFLNMFRTYIIYRFMRIFYEERRGDAWTEWFGYGLYYAVITIAYLVTKLPIVLLTANLCGLWALGFLYKTKSRLRLIPALSIYFVLMAIETGVVLLTGYMDWGMFRESEYTSITGIAFIEVCNFLVEVFCEQCKNIKKSDGLPRSYWFALIILPISSLYIIVSIFQYKDFEKRLIVFIIGLLFLCNICVFYLIDVIAKRERERSQYLIQETQVESIKKQMELLQRSSDRIRELRHDLKNHLHTIQSFNAKQDSTGIQKYINTLLQQGDLVESYINTGNITADGILNLKIMESKNLQIDVNAKVKMPMEMKISPYDWTVILGNLLDNAIEASQMLPINKRYIKIKIWYTKGTLLIHIENAFKGEVEYLDSAKKILKTTKIDKDSHGFGLKNIRETIKRYDGEIITEQDGNIFSADIILYIM